MAAASASEPRRAQKARPLIAWTPQPGPQVDAITADWCPILLYGGAKYGGKTDYLLGDYLQDLPSYRGHWQGVIFRRALTEFAEIKLRANELFPKLGGEWKEQKQEWHFPRYATDGQHAILRFRYLEKFEQISLYEGHSYPWLGIDELGDWEDANAFFRCLTLNRYGRARIPTLRTRATCNPGGKGHSWIKKYFIDPAPLGYQPIFDEALQCYRLFIPAKLDDNQIGLTNDPGYEHRLNRAGSPALVRALRYGDWNVVAGAFMSGFSSRNIVEPHSIPEHWTKVVSLDPGSSDPFAYTWWGISDGLPISDDGPRYPRGAMVCYREWYGEKAQLDGEKVRGLKLSLKEQADGLKERERGEKITYRVGGLDLWDTRKGPHDAELFAQYGIDFMRAEVKRKIGWARLHELIRGENDVPMVYWFKTCIKCIEHLPLLQHDPSDAEDVQDSPIDHTADSCRYAIMSRGWVKDAPPPELPIEQKFRPPTINELWSQHQKLMKEARR